MWLDTEVFSPGFRIQVEGQLAPLVRAAAGRQRLQARALGAGSRQATLDTSLAQGLTCSDASPRRPRTASPGEKTSVHHPDQDVESLQGRVGGGSAEPVAMPSCGTTRRGILRQVCMSGWFEQISDFARPVTWVGLLFLASSLTGCSSETGCDGFLGTWIEGNTTITITEDDDNYLVNYAFDYEYVDDDRQIFATACENGSLTGLPVGDMALIGDGEAIAWAGEQLTRASN